MDSKPMNARSDAPARADEPGKGDDVSGPPPSPSLPPRWRSRAGIQLHCSYGPLKVIT